MENTKRMPPLRQAYQKGVCRGCGNIFTLTGGPDFGGYIVSTHLATEERAAKLGIRCFGSDISPRTGQTTSPGSGLVVR